MNIERHKIDEPLAQELFDNGASRLPRFLDGARKNPKNLSLLIGLAKQVVHCGCIVDPNSPQIPIALTVGAQAHVALFSAASASPSAPVAVRLGDSEPTTYTTPSDESSVHVGHWIKGFCLNALRRDIDGLDALCRVPSESLRRSTTKGNEYSYLYMEALRSMRAGNADVADKLIAALKAVDPKQNRLIDPDWALYLVGHQLEVLMYVLTEDPQFNDGLTKAVQMHKEYWSKSEKRRRDFEGYIADELTALATMGQERGITVNVESPYLPMQLAR
jgi:hypothetical protein